MLYCLYAYNHHRVAKFGEGAPEAADLYFAYGKALLENAISQTAVLGKDQAEETLLKEEGEDKGEVQSTSQSTLLLIFFLSTVSGDSKPFISFSGRTVMRQTPVAFSSALLIPRANSRLETLHSLRS